MKTLSEMIAALEMDAGAWVEDDEDELHDRWRRQPNVHHLRSDMSGDFFGNKYFPDGFFPAGYFGNGETNPNAMVGSCSGVASVSGTLTSESSRVVAVSGRKRRTVRHTFVREEPPLPILEPVVEAVPDYAEEILLLLAA